MVYSNPILFDHTDSVWNELFGATKSHQMRIFTLYKRKRKLSFSENQNYIFPLCVTSFSAEPHQRSELVLADGIFFIQQKDRRVLQGAALMMGLSRLFCVYVDDEDAPLFCLPYCSYFLFKEWEKTVLHVSPWRVFFWGCRSLRVLMAKSSAVYAICYFVLFLPQLGWVHGECFTTKTLVLMLNVGPRCVAPS